MSVVHGMRRVGGGCEMCMCLARGGVGRGIGPGSGRVVCCYVCVSLDSLLCRWQVKVYCARHIPVHF